MVLSGKNVTAGPLDLWGRGGCDKGWGGKRQTDWFTRYKDTVWLKHSSASKELGKKNFDKRKSIQERYHVP